ncbi:MAG: penicillin-binding protein 1B [Candidatus Thiodiazotropha sp. (ex Gloverina cf. vestifex)]|nr:penicillin-binding protein 1B [Candidatus Thiodiazotropha sp. (ex Gloverina cf. vestifex)]
MAVKRSRRRSKSRRGGFTHWRRWMLLTVTALLLAGILYTLYLDGIVQSRFEGQRWAIPAKVYGRSMALFPAATISREQLRQTLDGLGYRRVAHPDLAGSYSANKNRFLLRTRSFQFTDMVRDSDYLEVVFGQQSIELLRRAGNGDPVGHYRLEPRLIGSLTSAHGEDRILLKREALPDLLVSALITVEDRDYFHHLGVDPVAIGRALWANIRATRVVQGGSTLTQQLVKNFFLTAERTLWRKFNEALMALILEYRYNKDEILEAYANEVYLGQSGGKAIHGFALASRFYFNRPLHELDLSRTALLVALVRGPSAYDPRHYPERTLKRRNLVLELMAEQGIIDQAMANQAKTRELGIEEGSLQASGTPAFMDLIRRQLRRDYREEDLNAEGLRIFSTLDPWVQWQAEEGLSLQLKTLEKARKLPAGTLQGALTLAEVETGEVMALVGDRNPRFAGFNRALDALRPVGSLIKPVVYLTALSQPGRYQLMSELEDKPIRMQGANGEIWQPGNYDNQYHGKIRLQQGLIQSHNLATVRLGLDVGLDSVINNLRATGIRRPLDPYPSLLLGAVSLSPLEMTQMYQTLANGGYSATLKAIREVTDATGKPLSRYPLAVKPAVDARAVFLLRHALQEVTHTGTAKALQWLLPAGVEVAGKTGTTDKLRDSWFAGFDRRRVGVVWVGRDDNGPMGLSGSAGAMRVWADLMGRIGVNSLDDRMPVGVEMVEVDPVTGLLGEGCKNAQSTPFISGSAPKAAARCARQNSMMDEGLQWLQQLLD